MTATITHRGRRSRTTPVLACAAVVGIVAVGAVAGFSWQLHHVSSSPTAPEPPVVSYPGSAVFDNQSAGRQWTRRDDFKRPGRTVVSAVH